MIRRLCAAALIVTALSCGRADAREAVNGSYLPPAIAPIFSSVLEAGHVLKATTGTIYGAQVNTSAADYVMLLNLSSIPASGTTVTPVGMWQVPANATVSLSFSPGLTLSTGIVVVCSSTGPTTFTPDPTCWFGSGIVQ